MVRVDELVAEGRHVGQDAEPSEWIHALVGANDIRGNALATDAMVPVTACNEIAFDLETLAAMRAGHARPIARDLVECDVDCFVAYVASSTRNRFVEIVLNFGLAVDRYALAGQPLQVDAMNE